MLRGEICISDWGGPVFQYIDRLVNSENPEERFDFSVRPELTTQQQKKEYIKNLLGLWNAQELTKQQIKAKIGKEYIIQQFPTAQKLTEFSLQFKDNRELKLNDSTTLKVDKIITSLGKGSFGISVAQILQDLGLMTEGKAFETIALKSGEFAEKAQDLAKKFNIEILRDSARAIESIKPENLEKAQINQRMVDAMTATQMMNIENSDVMILYIPSVVVKREDSTRGFESQDEILTFAQQSTLVKYAQFLGKDILINPTADEIRKQLYNRQQNNLSSSVYIEEINRKYSSKSAEYNAQINYFAHEIFDAFYRPYTPEDSLSATNVTSEFWNTATKLHYQNRKVLDSIMDPKIRRSRVNYISHMFSQTLTKLMKDKIKELEKLTQSDIFSSLTDSHKQKIQNQIDGLKDPDNGRIFYLQNFGGPKNVFDHVLKDSIYAFSLPDNANDHFRILHDQTKAAYINSLIRRMNAIENSKPENERLSNDEIIKKANERYDYVSTEFRKMREYFTLFAEEAATQLSLTEHIMIDFTDKDLEKFQQVNRNFSYDEDENGNVRADDATSEGTSKEESLREGWMSKFHEISSFDTLSKIVRQLLNNIKRYQYDDNQKKYVVAVDDIGRPIYLDQNYAHAVLIDILHNIYDSRDILPTLEKAKIGMPWIQGVIDAVNWQDMQRKPNESDVQFNIRRNEVAQLFNAFAHDMNKYFIPYWVQTMSEDENGRVQWKTVAVNKPEGTYYLLDQWRDNYESGIKLSLEHSIYNEKGEVDQNQAAENYKIASKLHSEINSLANKIRGDKTKTFKEHISDEQSQKTIDTLIDLMRSIGINTDRDTIISSIMQNPDGSNLRRINNALSIIFKEIKDGKVTNKDLGNGLKKLPDLINELGKQYNSIADLINKVSDDALESSVRQGDKTYYAHTTPSYWGNLIKELQDLQNKPLSEAQEKGWVDEYNSMPEDFKAVFAQPKTYFEYNMFHKYARFDWFFHVYRNSRNELVGQWMNGWLERLYNGDIRSEKDAELAQRKFRDELKHKVLLQADNKGYGDWSRKQHGIVLINEFNSEPIENGSLTFAYYDIPILADADSCEFIRFERFTNKNNYYKNANGEQLDYRDILLDKFTTLVIQEYNRIQEVEKRANAFKKGTLRESQRIDHYDDSSVDKQDARGRQFTFIPALNSYKDNRGKTFYEVLKELVNNGDKKNIEYFIKDTLRKVLNRDLMEDFTTFVNLGIYDVNENGKGINIHDLSESVYDYTVITPEGKELKRKGSKARKVLELTSAKKLEGPDYKFVLDEYNGEDLPTKTDLGRVISEIRHKANQIVQMEDKGIYRPLIIEDELLNQLVHFLEEYEIREDHEISQLPDNQKHPNRTELLTKELIELLDVNKLKSYQMHEEFFLNSEYAKSQFVQITCTDYAFFKSEEYFCKRVKQIHAPNSNLNTDAIWIDSETGQIERVGKLQQRTIVLKDEVKNSQILDELKQALDLQMKRGDITKLDRDFILSQYMNITLTDGQAFRTLKSFRDVQIMAGLWTYTKEDVYKKIVKGQPMKPSDFNVFYQTAKPYTYTQVSVVNGLQSGHNIKVPTQHKDSEFVLMAVYATIAQELGNNSKLVQLNQFMLDNNIDSAVFESSIKVGNYAAIDFTDEAISKAKENKKTALQYLQETINSDNSYIHKIDYKDYGIQQETPEHLVDKFQLVGTQLRKLITQDIPDNVKLTLNGKTYTKAQWLKLYECLNTENILQSFYQLSEDFRTIEDVRNRLLKEMIGNPRYTIDDQRSLDIIEDESGKRFALPICDPAKANKIQALINSVVRKSITNQKINGGACIQVSNWGMTDDLNIRWYDQNNEIIMTEKEFESSKLSSSMSYNEYKKQHQAVKVAYVECYMPAYSKKFFKEKYFDKNGNLNFKLIEKENPNLLKAIGYRIPTENTYSMLPLKIKGFMPQNNGSTIMLPMDWVQISGSDFDVDKLYMMLKDISENLEGNPFEQQYNFNNKEYSFDQLIGELRNMTTAQRNNIMIDMIYEMLTSEYSVPKFTRAGNFKSLERQVEIFDIEENTDYDTLVSELSNGKYFYEDDGKQKVITKEKIEKDGIYEIIKSLDNKSISNLAKKFKKKLNPLAPSTQMYFRYQNTAGFTLVGIYANGTSHHALMQDKGLRLTWERRKGLVINGHKAEFLDKIKALDGQTLISTNMSEPQAASVDNIKNPVLARLNQNEFTANIMPTLLRLGYSLEEVNYFLKQPIVMEITNRFFNEEVYDVDQIIEDVIQEYKLRGFSLNLLQKTNDEQKNLSLNTLTKAILLQNNAIVKGEQQYDLTEDVDPDIGSWYNIQLHVAHVFQNVYQISKDLSDLISATRSDTNGGGAGPMISNTQDKIFKLKDIIKKSEYGRFSFALAQNYDSKLSDDVNAKTIETDEEGKQVARDINVDDGSLKSLLNINLNDNEGNLREKLYNSKLPMLQAFYTLGIEGTYDLFAQYFPQMQQPIMSLMHTIQEKANAPLNPKTYNKIYNALFTYICSRTRFFGDEYDQNNNLIVTSHDKREYFITKFPEEFKEYLKQDKQRNIANGTPEKALVNKYEFLRRLSSTWADRDFQNDISIIRFRNIGQLTAIQKERYMSDWESMLYDDDMFVRSLAVNLFRYSYYRNGFGFGPDSFMHLCPLAVKLIVKDYADVLQKMTNPEFIQSLDLDSFVDQLFVNNSDDYHFVVKNLNINTTGTPDPTNTKSTISFLENGNAVFSFLDENYNVKLNYDDYSKQDKRLIKEINKEKGIVIPKRFFSVKLLDENGSEWLQLYKLVDISLDGTGAEYAPITDLGYQNKYLEYEYGANVENMESVFWFNSEESYNKYISEHKYEEPGDNVQREQIQRMGYIRAILDQSWKQQDYSSLFEHEDTYKQLQNVLASDDVQQSITQKEIQIACTQLFGTPIDFEYERSSDDSPYTIDQLNQMEMQVYNYILKQKKTNTEFASLKKNETFKDAQGIEKC